MLWKILPSLIFGGGLIAFGLWLMSLHRRYAQLNITVNPTPEEKADQRHLRRRFLRRMQASGMIALVGMLIPIADAALAIFLKPLLATILLLVILGLVIWIVLLAIGDLHETRGFSARSKAKIKQLQRHQEELQDEINRHYQSRSNGHADSSSRT